MFPCPREPIGSTSSLFSSSREDRERWDRENRAERRREQERKIIEKRETKVNNEASDLNPENLEVGDLIKIVTAYAGEPVNVSRTYPETFNGYPRTYLWNCYASEMFYGKNRDPFPHWHQTRDDYLYGVITEITYEKANCFKVKLLISDVDSKSEPGNEGFQQHYKWYPCMLITKIDPNSYCKQLREEKRIKDSYGEQSRFIFPIKRYKLKNILELMRGVKTNQDWFEKVMSSLQEKELKELADITFYSAHPNIIFYKGEELLVDWFDEL